MSQQHRKTAKRSRRNAYNKRQKKAAITKTKAAAKK